MNIIAVNEGSVPYAGYARLFIPYNWKIERSKFTSRASSKRCGNGPYFVAVRLPTRLIVDGSVMETGIRGSSRQDYYSSGKSGFEESSVFNWSGKSNANWSITIRTFDRFEVDKYGQVSVYWNQWTWTGAPKDATFRLPNSVSDLVSRHDQICQAVQSTAPRSYVNIRQYVTDRHGRPYGCGHECNGFSPAEIVYQLDEYSCFMNAAELGIFLHGSASRFSAAYVNAIEDLDLAACNTLENIREVVGTLKTLVSVIRHPIEAMHDLYNSFDKFLLKKSIRSGSRVAGELWLSYRYAYTTTMLDIKEYRELISRLRGLRALLGQTIHSTGVHNDNRGSFMAEVRVEVSELYPDSISEWLDTIGAAPTAQNIWDMIPYSFIVDWFFHIGTIIDYFDHVGTAIELPATEVWFTYMSDYDGQHVFYRVPGRRMDVLPCYVTPHASTKTIRMRVADTLSLLLTR